MFDNKSHIWYMWKILVWPSRKNGQKKLWPCQKNGQKNSWPRMKSGRKFKYIKSILVKEVMTPLQNRSKKVMTPSWNWPKEVMTPSWYGPKKDYLSGAIIMQGFKIKNMFIYYYMGTEYVWIIYKKSRKLLRNFWRSIFWKNSWFVDIHIGISLIFLIQ